MKILYIKQIHMYVLIYIYIYVCVCVCVCIPALEESLMHSLKWSAGISAFAM